MRCHVTSRSNSAFGADSIPRPTFSSASSSPSSNNTNVLVVGRLFPSSSRRARYSRSIPNTPDPVPAPVIVHRCARRYHANSAARARTSPRALLLGEHPGVDTRRGDPSHRRLHRRLRRRVHRLSAHRRLHLGGGPAPEETRGEPRQTRQARHGGLRLVILRSGRAGRFAPSPLVLCPAAPLYHA